MKGPRETEQVEFGLVVPWSFKPLIQNRKHIKQKHITRAAFYQAGPPSSLGWRRTRTQIASVQPAPVLRQQLRFGISLMAASQCVIETASLNVQAEGRGGGGGPAEY